MLKSNSYYKHKKRQESTNSCLFLSTVFKSLPGSAQFSDAAFKARFRYLLLWQGRAVCVSASAAVGARSYGKDNTPPVNREADNRAFSLHTTIQKVSRSHTAAISIKGRTLVPPLNEIRFIICSFRRYRQRTSREARQRRWMPSCM